MRTPVIAGNWKMNTDAASARDLVAGIGQAMAELNGVEVGVAPPFPYLEMVGRELGNSGIFLAGQDMHWETGGAFTGDVSSAMLLDVGCTHVILGHSERRHGWGETPEQVGKKVVAAKEAGLKPIVCVGETLEERQGDRTKDVLLHQAEAAFAGFSESDLAGLIIAYEPVWAIGTGVVATTAQAGEAHQILRAWLAERFSNSFAESVRIQYGGSVKPDNAAELMAVDGVDGALVGGASLKVEPFVGILRGATSS